MDDLTERLRSDQRFFAVVVAVVALVVIFSLIFVLVYFFGGDSDESRPLLATAMPSPTLSLSGVTVIAAPPASGDSAQPSVPANTDSLAPAGAATPGTTVAAQVADEPLPPFPADAFGYGVQVQGSVGPPDQTIASVQKLGMNWIKQQVRWENIEPGPGEFQWWYIDGIIEEADKANVYVMLSVVTAPAWARANSGGSTHGPPDDYNEFGRFLGQLVERYKGKIHAIEVWNEQNLDREWLSPNGLVAADYVRLLQVAQQQIKARDPNIIVISGALSPTGGWVESDGRVSAIDDFTYFQQMLDAGLLTFADCVGAHHNGINFPPDKEWDEGYDDPTAKFRGPFENPHHSWSFRSTLWGYYNMMGGRKKLCVTEFGWPSSDGLGGTPAGFDFSDDNTQQEQAEWIVQAFQLQRQWGITWIAYLWNMDYGNKGGDPAEDSNVHYSLVDRDGVPRPAYDALERMAKP